MSVAAPSELILSAFTDWLSAEAGEIERERKPEPRHGATILQAIRTREESIRTLEGQLALALVPVRPFVLEPEKILQELANLAGLLRESAERARPVLKQLNLQVTLFSIQPEEEPSPPAPWIRSPQNFQFCAAPWRKRRTVGKSVSPLICLRTSGQGGGGSGGVAELRLSRSFQKFANVFRLY